MASTDGSIACHRPDFEAEAFKLFELDATGVDSLPSSTRHTVCAKAIQHDASEKPPNLFHQDQHIFLTQVSNASNNMHANKDLCIEYVIIHCNMTLSYCYKFVASCMMSACLSTR